MKNPGNTLKATLLTSLFGLGLAALAITALAPTVATAQAPIQEGEARDQADWYPSRYGADDTIGALNQLGPEAVLKGAGLIKTGKVYALGGVTGRSTPAYGHRTFQLFLYPHGNGSGEPMGPNRTTFNDDFMVVWPGIGTQIDGFAHGGMEHRYYNGRTVDEVFSPTGAQLFGTHAIPPIATRGVVLDMAGLKGVEMLDVDAAPFGRADIEAAMKRQGVTIGKGDVVIFHTGWQRLATEDPQRFLSGQPGLGVEGAEWLADQGVVAVGADTWGLEAVNPAAMTADSEIFPVHQTLLARHGVYILENIQTAELIADEVSAFFFVLGIPRFEGAVQMVINPIAIR